MTEDQPLHPRVQHVAAVLRERAAVGTPRVLPASARTAAEAAAALDVPVGAIVNSLVFDSGGTPVLILTSGAHRVDTEKVARRLGSECLDRATPDFVRAHTGQAIGGVSPVGHPAPIRTVVDTALRQYVEVWAAAGHPHAVFPTSYDELLRLTGATPADVA